jgi:dipeptidyl aminopeptidase/acylaminoacyl peptidase
MGFGVHLHLRQVQVSRPSFAGFDTCTAPSAARCKCTGKKALPYSTSAQHGFQNYNPPMPRRLFAFCFLILIFLSTGTATPAVDAPYTPAFFYISLSPNATLFLLDSPAASPRQQIPLNPPTDCTLYALRPAPRGRWIAVEWECAFGPAVEMFDTASGESHFVLSNPTIDSRFLAWQPDGRSLYLKIGTLSVPQTLRVDVATGKATELFVSAFVYDLTASPDGKRVLYSLTNGIGFGSETWLAGPDGQNPSQLLVDAQNILALAQYSPDGNQIAYIRLPDTQEPAPAGELWVMDSAGLNPRKLAIADAGRGFPPVWSPGGDKIAFVGRDNPADEKSINLSVYSLTTSVVDTAHFSLLTAPVWSPDGAFIAFGSDKMDLWFYEISSGQAKKQVTGACCAGWIR